VVVLLDTTIIVEAGRKIRFLGAVGRFVAHESMSDESGCKAYLILRDA
jgi:hypothetical protein